MRNASEAVGLYVDALQMEGRPLPPARTLADLKKDAAFANEVRNNVIALISLPDPIPAAAE